MPTMQEIYAAHAASYDELVDREDAAGSLRTFLDGLADFDGARVAEFGVGTGRVAALYAARARSVLCFDASRHMMDRAAAKLAPFADRVSFGVFDHLRDAARLPYGLCDAPADIAIEGWSFGHAVMDADRSPAETCAALVGLCRRAVRPGGLVVAIETLGTCVDSPRAPAEKLDAFYSSLERDHGFMRTVLRTDYSFDDREQAVRVMGFFFGPAMAREVEKRGKAVVPEYTGVWTKRV